MNLCLLASLNKKEFLFNIDVKIYEFEDIKDD